MRNSPTTSNWQPAPFGFIPGFGCWGVFWGKKTASALRCLAFSGVVGLAGVQLGGCAKPVPPLPLVENGASEFSIVVGAAPSEAEQFAAEELAGFLERATGASIPVIPEAGHGEGPAVYLGWTEFAQSQGIDPAELGEEEWMLQVAEGNLLVLGGRPRGTLYAVYEFLERFAGVRFLDAKTEHVPETSVLKIPGNLDLSGQPAFSRREMMNGRGMPFDARLRINSFANGWREIAGKYGYSLKYGSPYTTHTHYRFVEDFPEAFADAELFAVDERGNRDPHKQVCMSHPEVRRLFKEKLREYIRRDREQLLAAGRGPDSFPKYYSLIPNDGSSGKCDCERCMEIAEKHGSYAAVVLDFTNDIAEDIATDHPEIVLATSAYTYYRDIPTGIQPRDNVMVVIAQLGAEFNTVPKRDALRGMLHPFNRDARAEWEAWAAISPLLGVHDYWGPWQQQIAWPYAHVRGTAETMKFYHEQGLRHFFTEATLSDHRYYNFPDLMYYLGARLTLDPYQPVEPIITEFTDLYYGPAAPVMRELLDYIEQRQEEEPGALATVQPAQRIYFDAEFFLHTDRLLSRAEELAEGDPEILERVLQERVSFDETMLFLWPALASHAGWTMDRQQVAHRLEEGYEQVGTKFGINERMQRANQTRLEYLRNLPDVPEQFAGKNIIDLCGPMLNLVSGGRPVPKGRTGDPEAATGKAWRITSHVWTQDRPEDHSKPPVFGLSDTVQNPKFLLSRKLTPDEIPNDEKYHWYKIGRMQATPTMYFFAHHSWVFDQRLLEAYNSALPDQNFYEVYVSLKLEGPAYVPGSTRENAFSIDRIILVKVDPPQA